VPLLSRLVALAALIATFTCLFLAPVAPAHADPLPNPRRALRLRDAPLATLSPAAADYLATRAGLVGVGVAVPDRAVVFATAGNTSFYLASVAKTPIMLTLLRQVADEGRTLSDAEAEDLWAMISLSDNAAADRLWNAVGGAVGVSAYLRSVGVTDIEPDAEGYWGASTATPRALALLLAKLIEGDALDVNGQVAALTLMGNIEALDQRWGVTAGLPDALPDGAQLGLKDGWYWAEEGWWINSVGYLVPPDGAPYTLVILTNDQPSFEYGVETVETVARLIHMELSGLSIEP